MDATKAVNQLVGLLETKSAEQIAEIEIILTRLGLTELAGYAIEAGIINAGVEEYLEEMGKAIDKTADWEF